MTFNSTLKFANDRQTSISINTKIPLFWLQFALKPLLTRLWNCRLPSTVNYASESTSIIVTVRLIFIATMLSSHAVSPLKFTGMTKGSSSLSYSTWLICCLGLSGGLHVTLLLWWWSLPLALPAVLLCFPSASCLQHFAQCPFLPHFAHALPLAGHTLSRAKCPGLPHA